MFMDFIKKIYLYFFGISGYTRKEFKGIKKLTDSNNDYVLYNGKKYFKYSKGIGITNSFLVKYGEHNDTVELLDKNGRKTSVITKPRNPRNKSVLVSRILPDIGSYCDFYYKITIKEFQDNEFYRFVNVLVSEKESNISSSHRYEDVLATPFPITEYKMGKLVKRHNIKNDEIRTKRIPQDCSLNTTRKSSNTRYHNNLCNDLVLDSDIFNPIHKTSSLNQDDDYSGGGGKFSGSGSGSSWGDNDSGSSSSSSDSGSSSSD